MKIECTAMYPTDINSLQCNASTESTEIIALRLHCDDDDDDDDDRDGMCNV